MTTIFNGYDEEYKTIVSSISENLQKLEDIDENDGEAKSNAIVHVGDLITQASQLIQQMELEVRSLENPTRKELTKRVNQYKKKLQSLKTDHLNHKEKAERKGLLGERDGIAMTSNDHRNRMENATDKLRGTTDRIAAARRTVADTEEVAIGITEELSRNRDTIESARDRLRNVNEKAREGGKIIGRMTSRERRRRVCLIAFVLFLGIGFLLVLYFNLFPSSSSPQVAAPVNEPETGA